MWKAGRFVAFGGVLAVLVAFAPTDALAQKKKKKDNATQYPEATDADYGILQKNSQKSLAGSIVSFDEKSLTLRHAYSTQQSNPNYKPPSLNPNTKGYNPQAAQQYQLYRRYNDLQNQMNRAAKARTPAQAAQAQMRIMQDMMVIQGQMNQLQARMSAALNNPNNQPFMQVKKTKDFTFDLQDKVDYRKTFLPLVYDDQGNPKKYTSEEKLALRADDKKNYRAKADEVQPGQEATIYLTMPKKKSKADDDGDAPARPTINKIVLTKDAPADTSPGQKDLKKKKKKN